MSDKKISLTPPQLAVLTALQEGAIMKEVKGVLTIHDRKGKDKYLIPRSLGRHYLIRVGFIKRAGNEFKITNLGKAVKFDNPPLLVEHFKFLNNA